MKKNLSAGTYKRPAGILAGATVLLFAPLIAMLFTSEVNWTFFDFLAAAILLFGTGLALEFILRKAPGPVFRRIAVITLFVLLLLVWAELAVGIFGTPFAGR